MAEEEPEAGDASTEPREERSPEPGRDALIGATLEGLRQAAQEVGHIAGIAEASSVSTPR